MISGHVLSFHERRESHELLLNDHVSEPDDVATALSMEVLFEASFVELAGSHVQYDTVVWILISLLLVLAWGIGLLMLCYLPIRRCILRKDISSRKLYVTPSEIVYKVTRPFFGVSKIETRIPLHLVLDIIIEQGCLQSTYGIHTFRIESISHGRAAPVDELQFQGVSNPGLLRQVIVTEAAKSIVGVQIWSSQRRMEGEPIPGTARSLTEASTLSSPRRSLTEAPAFGRLHSSSVKALGSSSQQHSSFGAGGAAAAELVLHRLNEVEQSVKKIESLVGASASSRGEC